MSLIKLAAEKFKAQQHQKNAVKKLNESKSLIAYHGLGSGKTLTSIMAGEKTPGTKLVLAPASLLHNYRKELHKFNISDTNYKLVSYEKFRRNPSSFINKYKPSMIIADEFHRTKDPDTLIGNTIRTARPHVKKFIGLTGSVAQNHPSEIGDLIYNATGKPILGRNKQEFKHNFIHEKIVKPSFIGKLLGNKPGIVEEGKHLDKFRKATEPYIHTFSGDQEYMKHIPQVKEEVRHIVMNNEQEKYYDYAFGKTPSWVKYKIKHNLPPGKRESVNLNAFLIAARQTSNSIEPYGGSVHTPKMDMVLRDIEHGIKTDKNFKATVYSNFLDAGLHPLAKRLKKHNIPYGMFTGEQTNSERNQMVYDYNAGKLKTMLLSPAGGEGLDLKGTKFMGILDQSWNPEKTRQAIGRAARFKSHESLPLEERKLKVVQYLSEPQLGFAGKIKRIFKKDTHAIGVDEYIYNRAQEKENLNKQFTDILKGMQ
jgi:SNF2 family DNA or RNA helicase